MVDFWQIGFFCILCGSVFCFDLLFRRVPNWLMLAACGLKGFFLFAFPALNIDFSSDWKTAACGLIVGFFGFLPFYVFRVMGAGDVKFFAVLGFWLGPAALLPVFVVGSLLSGIHAVGYVVLQQSISAHLLLDFCHGWWKRQWMTIAFLPGLFEYAAVERASRKGIPYAAYLAVGAIGFIFLQG